jgi:hypothetical protein
VFSREGKGVPNCRQSPRIFMVDDLVCREQLVLGHIQFLIQALLYGAQTARPAEEALSKHNSPC